MQPIFCQVQLWLNGSGSEFNHGNLTMISMHNLMATLTGCVIVYSRLKKVNEVCSINDPTTVSAAWRRSRIGSNGDCGGMKRSYALSKFYNGKN